MFRFEKISVPSFWTILCILCATTCLTVDTPAPAAITGSGDLVPHDPSTWTAATDVFIADGQYAKGTLRIDDDSKLETHSAVIGNGDMADAQAYVDGQFTEWTLGSTLGVGNGGWAQLHVTHGARIMQNGDASVGSAMDADARVYLDGEALWNLGISSEAKLTCGANGGDGEVNLTNGSVLMTYSGSLGESGDSIGIVDISGVGSAWSNYEHITVGGSGDGILIISHHGQVSTDTMSTSSTSEVMIIVSNDGMLSVGDLVANGTFEINAQAKLAAGNYTPVDISSSWTGGGVIKVRGGSWDYVNHTFIVAPAVQAIAGVQASIDLAIAQRIEVGDDLCMHFAPTAESTMVHVTVSANDAGIQNALTTSLDADETFHGSWSFDVPDLPDGDEVTLMFRLEGWDDIADDYQRLAEGMTVWHHDATNGWTEFAADDLKVTADGWASFTVSDFSSYAISSQSVPEPATLSALAVGGVAMLRRRRKRS